MFFIKQTNKGANFNMDLFFEPRKRALSKVNLIPREPEMSEFDSAFVCGMIKEIKPKKILEVGVAAGGSTAILLECIDMLGLRNECQLISVDLSERYWRDIDTGKNRKSGFLAEEYLLNTGKNFNHKFLLGNVLPHFIDDIGGNIDLVILDTAHMLPGEVLDIITVLPFLSKNAKVILHDVALSHYKKGYYIATQVLFDSIVAEKIVPIDIFPNNGIPLPNIAAFSVTPDTMKYIESEFYALTLPWRYMPADNELKTYRTHFSKYYNKSLIKIFDIAISMNREFIKSRNNDA